MITGCRFWNMLEDGLVRMIAAQRTEVRLATLTLFDNGNLRWANAESVSKWV